jgi:hypothetical protein
MPDFGRWTSNGGDPSLNEINRTDRFLDALANQQPVYSTDPSEAELAQLMAGWRDEVRTPPLMSPVTPRDAAVALTRAVESRKRTRMSMAVSGSVAGAGPGDALYGLHTMLFGESEQQRNDSVVLAAQTQMAAVQQLVDQGQWQAAQDKLQALTTTVATVNDGAQKQDLVNQWQQLTVKVDAKDANATLPPGAPPPEMPTPATVDQGTTTTPTTTSSAISATATSPSSGTSTTSTSPTSTTSPSDTTTATTTTTPTPTTPTTTTSTGPTSVTTSAQVQLPPPTSTVTTIAPQTQNQLTTPPSTPSPTTPPSTPLPTPSAVTPLPTPSAVTPLPTPSAVTPLPTPSAVTPLPTPSAVEPAPATTQAPAPKIVITTTPIEAPRQQDGPR